MTLHHIIRHVATLLLTVFAVAVLTFLAMRLVPGDPARLIVGPDAPAETVEAVRVQMGLDKPLHVQLWKFLSGLPTGDLGISYRSKAPVWHEIRSRLIPTFVLAVTGMGLALIFGIGAGILSALRRGTWIDTVFAVFSTLGISLPVFWVGILLMMLFAANLRWVPSGGWGGWTHLILPSVTLGLGFFASISRMTRSALLEVLQDDYIRTAKAKGVPWLKVLFKHALRNALLPIVTIAGLEFGRLLGGAVITETVFAWPGMGMLMVDSVRLRDYPTVQACVIVLAAGIALCSFLTDLLNQSIDPRLRGG